MPLTVLDGYLNTGVYLLFVYSFLDQRTSQPLKVAAAHHAAVNMVGQVAFMSQLVNNIPAHIPDNERVELLARALRT